MKGGGGHFKRRGKGLFLFKLRSYCKWILFPEGGKGGIVPFLFYIIIKIYTLKEHQVSATIAVINTCIKILIYIIHYTIASNTTLIKCIFRLLLIVIIEKLNKRHYYSLFNNSWKELSLCYTLSDIYFFTVQCRTVWIF